jgi:hypothetical protein
VRRALPGLLCCLLAAPLPAADDLGRLFTTPEQRRALDAARENGGLPANPAPSTATGPQPVDGQVVLNGVVRRRLGPDVVWVNGARAGADGRIRLRRGPDAAGRVVLEDGDNGGTARLKPGQFWEPSSGVVAECRGCGRSPAAGLPGDPLAGNPLAGEPAAEGAAAGP